MKVLDSVLDSVEGKAVGECNVESPPATAQSSKIEPEMPPPTRTTSTPKDESKNWSKCLVIMLSSKAGFK